jgi:ribose/xylose/arabinose/galactoside ABC-type transport system permease subunit
MPHESAVGLAGRSTINVFSLSLYVVFSALIVVFSVLSRTFLTFSNIYGTILNGAPLVLITCAINFALLTGTLDLSVAAVGYASGCVCGILLRNLHAPLWLAVCGGLGVAIGVGIVNSLLIVRLKMNAFLTTLGMMLAIRGVGKIITQDRTILMGKALADIRQMKVAALGGFPVLLFVVAAVVLACQVVLSHTRFGRYMVAVGCNERAARNVGIDVRRVRALALVTTSFVCGIAGIVWVITLGSVITRGLNGYEFLAIAAAVLGGTSLFGGRGAFFPGSLIGALILLFIADGLTIVGVSPYMMPFVRGAILFAAMYVDSLRVKFA